ncbi:MAG: Hsp20/alpha crystallin family protein [Patescibacteria group bacterium]
MLFPKKSTKANLVKENDQPSITEWLNYEEAETEGQLAIDVFQTDKKIIIKSTIAGVKPEDLKISLHHDLLTIKGHRSIKEEVKDEDYLYRECYWGSFSRSIILPAEVDGKRVEAELENGVLTITLYKSNPGQIEIKVKD